jgi:hypothetical protein
MKLDFEKELKQLINRYSVENESDTPDFILAQYVMLCLNAFNEASNAREKWYGRGPALVSTPHDLGEH